MVRLVIASVKYNLTSWNCANVFGVYIERYFSRSLHDEIRAGLSSKNRKHFDSYLSRAIFCDRFSIQRVFPLGHRFYLLQLGGNRSSICLSHFKRFLSAHYRPNNSSQFIRECHQCDIKGFLFPEFRDPFPIGFFGQLRST